MPIEFKKSPRPALGVEVEVQLIDKEIKDLTPGAQSILESASKQEDFHISAESPDQDREKEKNPCFAHLEDRSNKKLLGGDCLVPSDFLSRVDDIGWLD